MTDVTIPLLRQSVLICLPGDSSQQVIVPAFVPTEEGAQANAIALLKNFLSVPAEQWITQIDQTIYVTTLEIKQ